MDAPGQVPQVGDGLLGPAVGLVDQAPDDLQVGGVVGVGRRCPRAAPSPGRGAWPGPPAGPGCRRAGCARCAGASRWRRRASSSSTPRGSAPGTTAAFGPEQEVHHAPVDVDHEPHGPRGDEEEEDADHELGDVGAAAPGGPGVVAVRPGGVAEQAEPRVRAAADEGRRDAEDRLDPEAEGEPDPEEGQRDLGHEVEHRPPGGTVAQRRPQPPEDAGGGAERLGLGDVLAQRRPGQRPLPAAESPGEPQVRRPG